MTTTVDYLKKNEIPKKDWDIYLKNDSQEESTEGIEQHWVDKADEQQGHQFVLCREGNIWKEKYLAGLKCYQVKIDIVRGNFERWKEESPVSASTIENRMRFAKYVLWNAGIVTQGKEPRRKQILRGVKFLHSNPLKVKDLCLEIEQEKKAAERSQQKKIPDTIPIQNKIDKAGHNYFRLVDEKIKHFKRIPAEDRRRLEESVKQFRDEADARLNHINITSERSKVKLADLQLEE